MTNPTVRWDLVPIWGAFFKGDGVTPIAGSVRLTFTQRVTRVDGRLIYPEGHTIERTIGDTAADPATRDQVRAVWRAADEAAATAAGDVFDGAAWDAWWNVWITGAVFAGFPASDDPDIVETGYQVKVEERLASGTGKVYYVEPLLAHLTTVPPGINLGTVAVPPGSPTAPAPIYAKGLPGGVAALDVDGDVIDAEGAKVKGGGLSTEAVQDLVAAMLKAGTNVTNWVYDDNAGTLTLNVAGGGGGTDPEVVRDTIAAALVAGSGITISSVDGEDTITISVANATTTARGLVEMATTAESVEGSSTALAVTPAGAKSAAVAVLRENAIPTVRLGLFPESANAQSEAEFVAAAGEPVTSILVPYNYTQQPNVSALTALNARGVEPMIAWMPNGNSEAPADNAAYRLSQIIGGAHDAYMTTFLTAVRDLGFPVMVRWAHEMNGNWYSWSEQTNSNTAGQYVAAWRHVVDLARSLNANNIKWVWAPTTVYSGSTSLASLYPGSGYVDVVGVNGYNWGAGGPDGQRTPSQVFDTTFDELRGVARGKPLWLAEVGTKDTAGDKPAWFASFFDWLLNRGIAGFIYYNSANVGEGYDWRVNSSPAAAEAFTTGMRTLRRVTKPTGKAVAQADGRNAWTGRQDFSAADVVGLPAVVPTLEQIGAAPATTTVNFFTADHTLAAWNAGRQVTFDGSTAQVLTVPPDSAVAFPVGTTIDVAQTNTGQVTVTPGAGVTVNSRGALTKLAGRYAMAGLRKTATNVWMLYGDLSA